MYEIAQPRNGNSARSVSSNQYNPVMCSSVQKLIQRSKNSLNQLPGEILQKDGLCAVLLLVVQYLELYIFTPSEINRLSIEVT